MVNSTWLILRRGGDCTRGGAKGKQSFSHERALLEFAAGLRDSVITGPASLLPHFLQLRPARVHIPKNGPGREAH